ncbi:MmcQ/YjbR family DNA-binding protein [Vibrio sonorensis]|uniref:MmcQ/YjbR family DNA-binding protein n=1 Tax=Vibrio sonorensis TaxID=1004316 RepID=UPI0008DA8DA7|nr:MmcQ/YjbR family DNA-binding protein [Vibrio sonorensis]
MDIKQLSSFIDQFVEVEGSHPFGPDALVYKVRDKMFAILAKREGREYVTVKGAPEDNEVMCSQFSDITPGYHTNKKHWVTIYFNGDAEDGLVEDLCERSYRLVVSKLSKANRTQLGFD